MVCFHESHFQLTGVFNRGTCYNTTFLLSWNRNGFILAGHLNEKYTIDPVLVSADLRHVLNYVTLTMSTSVFSEKLDVWMKGVWIREASLCLNNLSHCWDLYCTINKFSYSLYVYVCLFKINKIIPVMLLSGGGGGGVGIPVLRQFCWSSLTTFTTGISKASFYNYWETWHILNAKPESEEIIINFYLIFH